MRKRERIERERERGSNSSAYGKSPTLPVPFSLPFPTSSLKLEPPFKVVFGGGESESERYYI